MLAGNEFLYLVDQHIKHVLIHGLEQMVVAGQLDVFGARDIASQIPSRFDRNERIAFAMKDQRRHPDRRQQMADVDFVISPQQGDDRTWTRYSSFESAEPF